MMNDEEAHLMGSGQHAPPSYEEFHDVQYQLMYSGHQLPEAGSFHRPVTPLQITIPEGDASPTVPVSCGVAVGKMHLNLFMCPGIHQPCIEVGNDLLSPKQFTIRGDKERQKDWKASIRVGRSSLRTHMEASTIDFYDHPNRCSGKCQSRNYVNSISDEQPRKPKRNSDTNFLKTEFENEISGRAVNEEKDLKSVKKARGRPRGSVNKPKEVRVEPPQDDQFFEEFFTDGAPPLPEARVLAKDEHNEAQQLSECSPFNDILGCLQNDPTNFWTQMQRTGVITHFCDDILNGAINLKQAVVDQPVNSNTANMLTRTAFALGIHPALVQRVQAIERNVYQQRKHDEMFLEIQTKLAEEQRLREQEQLHTALEIPVEHEEELIDVVSEYQEAAGDSAPGPSHVL